MAHGFAFGPIREPMPPGWEWVLSRAFGPMLPWNGAKPFGPATVKLALKLGLAARIGGRVPLDRLVAELGPESAESLRRAYQLGADRAEARIGAVKEVAQAAHREAVPVVVLGAVALELGHGTRPGVSSNADVTVLVARSDQGRLVSLLHRVGFADATGSGLTSQHAVRLLHGSGVAVEVHSCLPGLLAPIRLDAPPVKGAGWLDGAAVLAAGLAAPGVGAAAGVWLAGREVLAAHGLAHGLGRGLGRHGVPPGVYPAMRVLGDLADLGFRERAMEDAVLPLLADVVSRREALAALTAAGSLLLGGSAGGTEGDAGTLVRHAVLMALEDDFARTFRLRNLAERPRGGQGMSGWLRSVRFALWPSREAIRGMYGPRTAWYGTTLTRLRRLAELFRRRCFPGRGQT